MLFEINSTCSAFSIALRAELKIACAHRSITVQNLIWTAQSMICMVIVSGPKGVASKRTRNKVFSLAGKMRYATGREAIIKSVAWSFRLCWSSNFSSSEIDCVRGVDCYLSLKFSAVFFWFSFLLGVYGCVQEIYDLFIKFISCCQQKKVLLAVASFVALNDWTGTAS